MSQSTSPKQGLRKRDVLFAAGVTALLVEAMVGSYGTPPEQAGILGILIVIAFLGLVSFYVAARERKIGQFLLAVGLFVGLMLALAFLAPFLKILMAGTDDLLIWLAKNPVGMLVTLGILFFGITLAIISGSGKPRSGN